MEWGFWRGVLCQNIEQRFADVVVRPLIEALVDPIGHGVASRDAKQCVVMGLG